MTWRYGTGIGFILVGAIMAFATNFAVPGVDWHLIGWIFIGVGVLALILAAVHTHQVTHPRTEEVIERRNGPAV